MSHICANFLSKPQQQKYTSIKHNAYTRNIISVNRRFRKRLMTTTLLFKYTYTHNKYVSLQLSPQTQSYFL